MSRERKSLMTFPCTFPLKIIGKNEEGFALLVASIIRRHVPGIDGTEMNRTVSEGGKYLSITVTFIAQSQEQLDALYSDLGKHEEIIIVL